MPIKSRWRIHGRESSAALAFANSVGLIPIGAAGATGAAFATGANGSTGVVGIEKNVGDSPCELAALVSSKPPAPAAPSRNISLRFNDMETPLLKRGLYIVKA